MKAPVVVIDAASDVGRGVVEAALAAARPVVAVSSEAEELASLRENHADSYLTTLVGSIADEARGVALAAALRDLARPIAGIVVADPVETVRGRVLDQPASILQRHLERELLPQLAAARALLPLLADAGRSGGYVVIGSPGGEHPWSGYGHRSVGAAAKNMLVRVLHDEARPLGVRVQLLAISRPVRTARNRESACPGWPDATAIGEQALALIDRVEATNADAAIVPFSARSTTRIADGPGERATQLPRRQSALAAESTAERMLDRTWRALEPIFVSLQDKADNQ